MKANLASIWMVTIICSFSFSVVAFDCVGQSEFSKKKKKKECVGHSKTSIGASACSKTSACTMLK